MNNRGPRFSVLPERPQWSFPDIREWLLSAKGRHSLWLGGRAALAGIRSPRAYVPYICKPITRAVFWRGNLTQPSRPRCTPSLISLTARKQMAIRHCAISPYSARARDHMGCLSTTYGFSTVSHTRSDRSKNKIPVVCSSHVPLRVIVVEEACHTAAFSGTSARAKTSCGPE